MTETPAMVFTALIIISATRSKPERLLSNSCAKSSIWANDVLGISTIQQKTTNSLSSGIGIFFVRRVLAANDFKFFILFVS